MKPKSLLSLLLALAILGGLLLLFPALWVALLVALIALIAVQVALVRRHLYSVPSGRDAVVFPEGFRPANPPPAADGTPPAGPAAEPGAPEAPALDQTLFSRFRAHLETAERQGTSPPAEPAAPPSGDDALGVEDRVELSRAARRAPEAAAPTRKAPVTAKAAPPAAAPKESGEEPDIFDDLRPQPVPRPPESPPPGSPAPEQEHARRSARARRSGRASQAPEPAAAPPEASEPTPDEAAPGAPESAGAEASAPSPAASPDTQAAEAGALADEAQALLHLAEEAVARQEWEGLRAALENYFAHLAEAPDLVHWRARLMQVRLRVHDGDANKALQGFEAMLKAGLPLEPEGLPALLDELLGDGQGAGVDGLRVSMLVRILAQFRQARHRSAMDSVYGLLEQAQERVGDERKLLQYLKNHLEIRKVAGDVPGQLELIDQIGNRCYKLGLTEDAKHFYEMGLKLRAELQSGKDEAGTPSPEPGARPGGNSRTP